MSDATDNNKQPLVPKLRFPEFDDADEWSLDDVCNLVKPVTPPKKIPSSQYGAEGLYPIVDQSKEFYCGWTDDETALLDEDLPLIVFGDHTCHLKLVDEQFAQGADGIKILRTKGDADTYFLYQYLLASPVESKSYKRHFSTLKEKRVPFPTKETGEQQKIADCLASLDELIAAHDDKLDALAAHKKGLLQQLFPRHGTTTPSRRFPEFHHAGEWELKTLGEIANVSSGGTPNRAQHGYWGGSIPWITTSLIHFNKIHLAEEFITEEGLANSSAKRFPSGTIIMAMYGQGKTRGKVAQLGIEATTNQACAALIPIREVSSNFIFQSLGSRYSEIRKLSNEGGQKNLSARLIKEIPMIHPELPEQQKIADCLSSLDELIAATRAKRDALAEHKKGLMQQLFPVLDEDAA